MDIFRNEETRVAARIDAVVPQFEEIGQCGRIISGKLHEIKNALKYPKSSGHSFLGSQLPRAEAEAKLEKVKNELDVYAEKSKAAINDVTRILTEIRYEGRRNGN